MKVGDANGLAAALTTALVLTAPLAAAATPRSTAIAAQFASWCLRPDWTFAEEDQRATEAGAQVLQDRNAPISDGQYIKQKNWLVADKTGTFMLMSTDVVGPAGHVTGCGVTALDVEGPNMEAAISALGGVGAPTKHPGPDENGTSVVWWTLPDRPGARMTAEIMMAYGIPNSPGVTVQLMHKDKAG